MNQPQSTFVIDAMLDPLSRCLDASSAKRVAGFKIEPTVQARIDMLAEQANEGRLTADDQAEYEACVNAADFIAILKLKAQRYLKTAK